MIGDVAGYKIALFFHILAVVVALGPTFGYGDLLLGAAEIPARGTRADRRDAQDGPPAGEPGMILLLIAGVVVLATSGSVWKGSQFFVDWGFFAIIVLFDRPARLLRPADGEAAGGRRARSQRRGTSFSTGVRKRPGQRIAQVGAATGLMDRRDDFHHGLQAVS